MAATGAASAAVTITAAQLQSNLDGVNLAYFPFPATPAMIVRGFYASGARFDHEDDQPLTIRGGVVADDDIAFTDTNICEGGTPASPLPPGVGGTIGGTLAALEAGVLRIKISSAVNLNQYTAGPVTVTLFYDALPGTSLSNQ